MENIFIITLAAIGGALIYGIFALFQIRRIKEEAFQKGLEEGSKVFINFDGGDTAAIFGLPDEVTDDLVEDARSLLFSFYKEEMQMAHIYKKILNDTKKSIEYRLALLMEFQYKLILGFVSSAELRDYQKDLTAELVASNDPNLQAYARRLAMKSLRTNMAQVLGGGADIEEMFNHFGIAMPKDDFKTKKEEPSVSNHSASNGENEDSSLSSL